MERLIEKLHFAITKYISYGEDALIAFQQEDFEQFYKLIEKRQQVFHNFCTLEYLAKNKGYQLSSDDEFKPLLQMITKLNSQLKDKIVFLQQKIADELKHINNTKNIHKQFHSHRVTTKKFVKMI